MQLFLHPRLPVHSHIDRVGDKGDGSLVHISELFLQCMQNGQNRAGKLLKFLDDGVARSLSQACIGFHHLLWLL